MAQVVTGQGVFGQYLSINLGFGLGVAMGVHVGGKVSGMRTDPYESYHQESSKVITIIVLLTYFSCFLTLSGAHMNAAVSFTMCAFGRLAWKMLPLYVFAQLLGSFLAAGTIYGIYYGESTLGTDLI